jgi:hypothetical protein
VIDQVINGILTPWGRRCSAAQKESAQAKYVEDAKLIENFHTPDKLKQVAYNQYLELVTIHRAVCVEKAHELTSAMLFKATSCVITGWYTNAPPGRSMELQTLPRKTVDEFLDAEDAEHFSYTNYKTFRIYGAGGKWVCPANRQAFSLYRGIVDAAPHLFADADPENFYFFQKQTISVHTCLRSASATEKLDPPLKVNLARKVYAVWAKLNKTTTHKGEDADDLFAKVARSDKHKVSTAAGIYGAITPAEDARLSKHCFHRLMGEPIPFPSLSDWERHGRSLDDVMARCRGGDVDQDAGEGEEEEQDIEELVDNGGDEAIDEWADVLGADASAVERAAVVGPNPRGVMKPKAASRARGNATSAPDAQLDADATPRAASEEPQTSGGSCGAAFVDPHSFVRMAPVCNVGNNSDVAPGAGPERQDHAPPPASARFRLVGQCDEGEVAPGVERELEALLDTAMDAHAEADGQKGAPGEALSHVGVGGAEARRTGAAHGRHVKKDKKDKKDKTNKKEKKDKGEGARDDDEQLSQHDQQTIWKHSAASRGDGFLSAEKKFIVKMSRRMQKSADDIPSKNDIGKIISIGIARSILTQSSETDHEYYERVRHFIRKFLKMASISKDVD